MRTDDSLVVVYTALLWLPTTGTYTIRINPGITFVSITNLFTLRLGDVSVQSEALKRLVIPTYEKNPQIGYRTYEYNVRTPGASTANTHH
jgi:hypothetical protein